MLIGGGKAWPPRSAARPGAGSRVPGAGGQPTDQPREHTEVGDNTSDCGFSPVSFSICFKVHGLWIIDFTMKNEFLIE